MPPYIVAHDFIFCGFLASARGCSNQLTQVRIAKLCLKYGDGALIKRAVAHWTPSQSDPMRLLPVRRNGSQPIPLRAMKSAWPSTWR
jgi:hypothetical protein